MLRQIHIKNLYNSKYRNDVIKLYKSSFPFLERVFVTTIKSRIYKKRIILHIYLDENNKFIGFTICIIMDCHVYVYYIATIPEARGKGYGAEILDLVKKLYKDYNIFLGAEDNSNVLDKPEDIKNRRINFYLRNYFKINKLQVKEFSVKYKILSTDGEIPYPIYKEVMYTMLGRLLCFIGVRQIKS